MTPAEIRIWKALKGKRVYVRWRNPLWDWTWYKVVAVETHQNIVRFRVVSYPDGSAKHKGYTFWASPDDAKEFGSSPDRVGSLA
jgi:hypothetical protein